MPDMYGQKNGPTNMIGVMFIGPGNTCLSGFGFSVREGRQALALSCFDSKELFNKIDFLIFFRFSLLLLIS